MTQEAQLKACPNAEAIAQQIADRTRWKKSTDTYARIYQAAYAAAILTEQTRIESGVVAELAEAARLALLWQAVIDPDAYTRLANALAKLEASK